MTLAALRRLLRAIVGPGGALAEKGATVREICWDALWIGPVALANVGLDDLLKLLQPTGFALVVCWTCQLAFLIGTLGKYALHVVGDWLTIHRLGKAITMTSKRPLTESSADAGYRRPDVREWCRRTLDIIATGVVAAVVSAAVVLPFAALGLAWGVAIVAMVVVALVAVLTVRHYNRVLLFALRRSPDQTVASLGELFDAFAAQRCTEVPGARAVVEVWAARLSKWFAGSRSVEVRRLTVRSGSH